MLRTRSQSGTVTSSSVSGSSHVSSSSTDILSSTDIASAKNVTSLNGGRFAYLVFQAAGRREANWCQVTEENREDFVSEYLIGCWLSPDPTNLALSCVCGANRARSFLRRERRWKQQVERMESGSVASHLHPLDSFVDSLAESARESSWALSPEVQALRAELHVRLVDALIELTELTEAQRQVLYLRYLEAASFAEIAQKTGQTPSSAKMLLRRGKRRLVAFLESSGLPCGEACEYLAVR